MQWEPSDKKEVSHIQKDYAKPKHLKSSARSKICIHLKSLSKILYFGLSMRRLNHLQWAKKKKLNTEREATTKCISQKLSGKSFFLQSSKRFKERHLFQI